VVEKKKNSGGFRAVMKTETKEIMNERKNKDIGEEQVGSSQKKKYAGSVG